MTIGDWGADLGQSTYIGVQKAVALKMQNFYDMQKANGFNLLFIAAVGDNFYWNGQSPCDENHFNSQWSDIYGSELTSVPWLAVMGNHDWGNYDSWAMCAFNNPRYIDNITDISYSSNQLNMDKLGCNPSNYYMPDFGYYYTINELSFELIALEQSVYDCPNGIGGDSTGSSETFANCGTSTVGCDILSKMANASEIMMVNRAKESTNSNFLIMQHYPSRASDVLNQFTTARASSYSSIKSGKAEKSININTNGDKVWTAYGHAHSQQCDGYSSSNSSECELIMTGGGGGCCAESTKRGFYVIGFDNNKQMIQQFGIDDEILTCDYPCGASEATQLTQEEKKQLAFDTCCHTNDDIFVDCNKFDLSLCKSLN